MGGIRALEYDPQATFYSSLAPNGHVSWTTQTIEKCFETEPLSSSLSYANAVSTKLIVKFPYIDWQSLQSVYGWAALQWQAWARGLIRIGGDDPVSILLYIDNVLEFWVNDQHYFGGDLYGYRRTPLVLYLNPGDHTLNIRLVRDVRAMGGNSEPSISLQLKIETSTRGLAILNDSMILPETVNGMPAGHYGSFSVTNLSNDWLSIQSIEFGDPKGGINALTVGCLDAVTKDVLTTSRVS